MGFSSPPHLQQTQNITNLSKSPFLGYCSRCSVGKPVTEVQSLPQSLILCPWVSVLIIILPAELSATNGSLYHTPFPEKLRNHCEGRWEMQEPEVVDGHKKMVFSDHTRESSAVVTPWIRPVQAQPGQTSQLAKGKQAWSPISKSGATDTERCQESKTPFSLGAWLLVDWLQSS